MNQWVVFGFGNFISDIFDVIHACQGKVKAVVRNLTPTQQQANNLKQRIAFLRYTVSITDLTIFQPQKNEKYFYGFIKGRDKLVLRLKKSHGIEFSSLIHPTAYLGSNVSYGEGVCVNVHSVVAPNCTIGDFCIINRACSIGHDSVLGDFSTIAPGVTISGMVRIGARTLIGVGATIMNDICIGKNSIVGAGSVVLDNVPDGVVVVGTPARILRKNK